MAFDWVGELRVEVGAVGQAVIGAYNVLQDLIVRTDPRVRNPPDTWQRPPYFPPPVATPPIGFQPTPFPPDVVAPPPSAPPAPVVPPTTSVPDLPSTAPRTTVRAPRAPRIPGALMIPGLLLDQWLQLWYEYLHPQPYDFPTVRKSKTRRRQEQRAEDPMDPCEDYPYPNPVLGTPTTSLCNPVQYEFPKTGEIANVDDWITTRAPGPLPYPRPTTAESYLDISDFPNPFEQPLPQPLPRQQPQRPARRTTITEPGFPWPSDPITTPRTRAQPRPFTPRVTQPRVTEPDRDLDEDPITQPQPDMPPPDAPADPCAEAASEKKREQRRRRAACTVFVNKTIRVCADPR